MSEELLTYTIWVRNDATGEAAQFKGQGTSVPAAFKEGWDNANEAFGKSSDGGFISEARLGVVLRDGTRVLRRPADFASGKPYDPTTEAKPAPVASGDAAKTHATLVEEGKAEWKQFPKKGATS